eukprot:GCRY01009989.1.p1 GENE.GCRY01009989.1~~GCRY01009989.1.p1  ORF type:complete len:134 (+),score=10.26 GCRY01009989.1:131-532(+)
MMRASVSECVLKSWKADSFGRIGTNSRWSSSAKQKTNATNRENGRNRTANILAARFSSLVMCWLFGWIYFESKGWAGRKRRERESAVREGEKDVNEPEVEVENWMIHVLGLTNQQAKDIPKRKGGEGEGVMRG